MLTSRVSSFRGSSTQYARRLRTRAPRSSASARRWDARWRRMRRRRPCALGTGRWGASALATTLTLAAALAAALAAPASAATDGEHASAAVQRRVDRSTGVEGHDLVVARPLQLVD